MQEGISRDNNKDQELREKRYQAAVEKENNPEIRETIDIFGTPVFFRKDRSVLAYVEYDRSGGIRTSARSLSRITGLKVAKDFRSNYVYLEAPIPYQASQRSKMPSQIYDGAVDIMANEAKEKGVGIKREDVARLMDEVQNVRNLGKDHFYQVQDEQERKSKQDFLERLVSDADFRKIWLFGQRLVLTDEIQNLDWGRRHPEEVGLYSGFGSGIGRSDSFLISPEKTESFTIASMSHSDFMFEILALKDIDKKDILGYIEYQEEDAETILSEKLRNEVIKLIGFVRSDHHHYGNQHIYFEQKKEDDTLTIFMARLKELFPYQDFNEDTLEDDVMSGLERFFLDKYGCDIKETKVKEAIEGVVKGMGIPIYNLKGDQLWPEQKSHGQIVEELTQQGQDRE